jgi:asparagine synthase (glutamine-hydrolysing)
LRRILYQYFPPEWIERPKAGFGAPVGAWLQNELKDWADDLLHDAQNQNFFNYEQIEKYRAQLGKRSSAVNKLWAVLMFQMWARREGING